MSVAVPNAWSDDALFVGLRIVERLREQMPDLREVTLIDDLAASDAEPRQVPAAIVLMHSMKPTSTEPLQERIPVEQLWLVMLAVRSARADPDRKRSALGPLIAPCIKALQGWVPAGTKRALAWTPGPRPNYGGETAYLPLMFRIQLITT